MNQTKTAEERRGRAGFAFSLAAMIAASAAAGALLRPALERLRAPPLPANAGELALFLEHTAVDVRLGRGAALAPRLAALASQVKEPVTRERVLSLWTEASVQAGNLRDAAASEEKRETLVEESARGAVRLRRVGLAAALKDFSTAAELARPLLAGDDSRLADEARLQLASLRSPEELRAWVSDAGERDTEDARCAGLAAMRLLDDAGQAARLLEPLERGGLRDESVDLLLVDVYSRLGRPLDLARVARRLSKEGRDESERVHYSLLQAHALARAGSAAEALAVLDELGRSTDPAIRQPAHLARYEILAMTGGLPAEMRKVADPAERAFVALRVEHDYAEAARLYRLASAQRSGSTELAASLREAERLLELSDRRRLYEQILAKDEGDARSREKLLAVLVALGDRDGAHKLLDESLRGHEASPDALLAAAASLRTAGLPAASASYLEKAYGAETDPGKKQQILLSLGELYAGTQQESDAFRLYTSLAAEGANPDIRDRAVAHLATLLH